MNIEYVRNIQSSFMRVASKTELLKTEEEMLSRNTIEGILKTSWQKEDGNYLLQYDITGKQALDVVLGNTTANDELLLKLISGICQTCRRLERYLLSGEALLLKPELIFWDNKKEMFCFCYCPGEEMNFQEQFIRLMEYLLVKTNHKDVHAVEIAYGVYEEVRQENYSLLEVQKRIEKWRENRYLERKEIALEEESSSVVTENPETVSGYGESSWKQILKEKIELVKEKLHLWIKPGEELRLKRKAKEEQFAFGPEDEEFQVQGLPTVLLAVKKGEEDAVLKYEGRNALPDLYISRVPYLIGSANMCDGIIPDATISRQHARITKVDDVYFVEDLNSSNGTRVEGQILSYKTKASVKKGDVVFFSDQPYRFL